jgi:6,7-dimethyl-8-ribityllumazine synthase
MADQPHVMLIEARFYPAITDELVRGAVAALGESGATYERFAVPGAFEIPAAIQMAVRARSFSTLTRRFDGYVTLGCVMRGETTHYDYVCQESARALQDLALRYTLALGYGILTVDNEAQAWERARVDRRDKGGHAARTCLQMIDLKRHFNLFPR